MTYINYTGKNTFIEGQNQKRSVHNKKEKEERKRDLIKPRMTAPARLLRPRHTIIRRIRSPASAPSPQPPNSSASSSSSSSATHQAISNKSPYTQKDGAGSWSWMGDEKAEPRAAMLSKSSLHSSDWLGESEEGPFVC